MSELLRATIALQDDSIHMLEAENKRLTAEKSEAIQAFAEQVRENERLQAKIEQLEGAVLGFLKRRIEQLEGACKKQILLCPERTVSEIWVALKGGDKDDGKD